MTFRALASGTLVDVAEDGTVEILECGWLCQVPSGNPEPDSESDLWTFDPCPAKVKCLTDDPEVGHRCEHGHERWPYGSTREQWLTMEMEARMKREEIGA